MTYKTMDSRLPRNPDRNWARLDGVDLLRALAIFFVLMNHVNMRLRFARVPYLSGLPEQPWRILACLERSIRRQQIFLLPCFRLSDYPNSSAALGISLPRECARFLFAPFSPARIAPLLIMLPAVLSASYT